MKPVLVLLMVMIQFIGLNGQSIERSIISSFGFSEGVDGVVMDVTVGEFSIQEFASGSIMLSQGFHQPQIMMSTIQTNEPAHYFQIFPNPTSETIFIGGIEEPVSLSMVNSRGDIVYKSSEFMSHKLNISNWPTGVYTIILEDKRSLKSYSKNVVKL